MAAPATTAASGGRGRATGSSAVRSSPTGRRTGSGSCRAPRGGPPDASVMIAPVARASTSAVGPSGEASTAAQRRARSRRRRAARLFRFDRSLGARFVAGADEAGRGSLAGPLVAAAVLLDLEGIGLSERRALAWLDDSKQKSLEQREEL